MATVSDHESRLCDYLDDKLQTLVDLESLDNLLLNVRDQQSLLQQQLEDARIDLQNATTTSSDHASKLKADKIKLEQTQRSINERLKRATQANNTQEAVRKFESNIAKLQRFDIAKGYIELLQQVEATKEKCLASLSSPDSTSLNEYIQLRSRLDKLILLQQAADGAAPHLIDHVQMTVQHIKKELEQSLTGKLEVVLKKAQWPKLNDSELPQSLKSEFNAAVSNLLRLQKPDLELHIEKESSQPLILLPFKILIQPLELGFRYHFDGKNIMNRLDKPEFYLSHVSERILSKYIDFVQLNIQPVLIQEFNGTNLALNYAFIDATSAFITALIPIVRTKSLSVYRQIYNKPALLSHFIHELMRFDTELRDEWQYDTGSTSQVWPGVTGEVLSKDDAFEKWLQSEKDHALARYHEIVEKEENFELDFDSYGEGKTKPSKASIQVNDLLEAMTDNYRELVSFQYKLRFLLDIQVAIFDAFYRRLEDGYISYMNRTSTIARISNAGKEEQTKLLGLDGLKSLCRVFGSADYLEKAMQDWNDDVFFLELWSELQHKVSINSGQQIVTGLTVADVASQTSKSLQGDHIEGEDIFEGGAIFDETASSYSRIRLKAEKSIAELLTMNTRNALQKYTRLNTWSSLSSSTSSANSITAELDPLLQTINIFVGYLARAFGTIPLRKVVKEMLNRIDDILYERIVKDHNFSQNGASQFTSDLTAIESLVYQLTRDKTLVNTGLARIRQVSILLNLPNKEADENSESFNLQEVYEKLVGGINDEAKELLSDLGIDRLGIFEAGRVIVRRVEIN